MKSKIRAELGHELDVATIVSGQKTYPSWTTNTEYALEAKPEEDGITVYFQIKKSAVPRMVKRKFPKSIRITPRLMWTLGFLKGEGANKLGRSNYRRVTVTNTNANDIRTVLEELEYQGLLSRNAFPERSIHIFAKTVDRKHIDYWKKELHIREGCFQLFQKPNTTTKHGVCHIYISDVLLRRVLDLLEEYLRRTFSPESAYLFSSEFSPPQSI